MTGRGEFHTRQVLSDLRNAIYSLPTSARLPDVPASQKALRELSAVDAAPSEPEDDALEQVRQRLKRARAGAGGVKAVDPRDIRDSVWLLWSQKEPLFSLPGLFEAILELANRRPSVRRNLVEAWIRGFSPHKPGIEEAGHAIRRLISNPDDMRLAHWREADQRFGLFDARGGPEAVAGHILSASEPVDALERVSRGDVTYWGPWSWARLTTSLNFAFASSGFQWIERVSLIRFGLFQATCSPCRAK